MRTFQHERATVMVADTTAELADRAAGDFAAEVKRQLAKDSRKSLNAYFAGAQSQMAFHAALVARADIPWDRIDAFAVDEFWAPHIPREYAVCTQPQRDLYRLVRPRSVNVLDPAAPSAQAEAERWARGRPGQPAGHLLHRHWRVGPPGVQRARPGGLR